MKLKTQILAIALGLAASTSLVWSADRPLRETTPTIQGVWQVTRMGVDCNDPNQTRPPFPALMTFYRDGTLTAYANPPGTGPLDTPEAGLWQRDPGSQNYSFHDISYVYDENGAFAGSGVVTANVHLTSANSFEYSATIQFFDADGNLLFSGCGRATGTRFE
jgi:S-methylmethionine-dependent homocysteine/selenocysteine methylase